MAADADIEVEVVLARPRASVVQRLRLPAHALLRDAVAASGLEAPDVVAYAIHGVRAREDAPLRDGDRIELLRPLQLDPKEARRRRAAGG